MQEKARKRGRERELHKERENEINERQNINNFIRKLNDCLVHETLLRRRKKRALTFCKVIRVNRRDPFKVVCLSILVSCSFKRVETIFYEDYILIFRSLIVFFCSIKQIRYVYRY